MTLIATDDIDILTQRRKEVLAQIEATGPEHFNMSNWFTTSDHELDQLTQCDKIDIYDCGTAACLAGHAAIVMHREGYPVTHCSEGNAVDKVADWLGVDSYFFHVVGWKHTGIEYNGFLYRPNHRTPYDLATERDQCDYEYNIIVQTLKSLIDGTYTPSKADLTIVY